VGIAGKSWDEYWLDSAHDRNLFSVIAKIYRRYVISPAVRHYSRRYFRDETGNVYLHAGCGSAESDGRIGFTRATLVYMDISHQALRIARRNVAAPNAKLVCGDIFAAPFRAGSIDGAWNLGVMEHFHVPELERIFADLARVLRPAGRCLIFWPPRYGLSVLALTSFLRLANAVRRAPLVLYPDEVSLYASSGWARRIVEPAGLVFERAHFGVRDLFTYVVLIVARPSSRAAGDREARDRAGSTR